MTIYSNSKIYNTKAIHQLYSKRLQYTLFKHFKLHNNQIIKHTNIHELLKLKIYNYTMLKQFNKGIYWVCH